MADPNFHYEPRTDDELIFDDEEDFGLEEVVNHSSDLQPADSGTEFREYRFHPSEVVYVPKYAYELRDLITRMCHDKDVEMPKGLSHMKKEQLYAIYFSMMKVRQAK